MKKVFLDTNILIDFLADRPPFSKFAVAIFELAEQKKYNCIRLPIRSLPRTTC